MRSLDSLPAGSTAALGRLDGERGFRRRLMEFGLLPGAEVRIVRRVDIGGLIELEVRGSRLTLRRSEADQLFVEDLP